MNKMQNFSRVSLPKGRSQVDGSAFDRPEGNQRPQAWYTLNRAKMRWELLNNENPNAPRRVLCDHTFKVLANFSRNGITEKAILAQKKLASGDVISRLITAPLPDFGKKKIYETLTRAGIEVTSTVDAFLSFLADELMRQSVELQSQTEFFAIPGRHPERGLIVFDKGVLFNGHFLLADSNRAIRFSPNDVEPVAFLLDFDSRFVVPWYPTENTEGEIDETARDAFLRLTAFCRGERFVISFALQIIGFLATPAEIRKAVGCGIPMEYKSGQSDAGKSQSQRDVMHVFFGFPLGDERPYSFAGTTAMLRCRLASSAMPIVIGEANKPGNPLSLTPGREMHDRMLLPLYDGADMSNMRDVVKPLGQLMFNGRTIELRGSENAKRVLEIIVPQHDRTSENVKMFESMASFLPAMRHAILVWQAHWSRNYSELRNAFFESAKAWKQELQGRSSSLCLNLPDSDVGHYAILAAACKVTQSHLGLMPFMSNVVDLAFKQRNTRREFGALVDFLEAADQLVATIPRIDSFRDERGFCEITANRMTFRIGVQKFLTSLKQSPVTWNPCSASHLYAELGITTEVANSRHRASRYSWVRWRRDNPQSENAALGGVAYLEFQLARESLLPEDIRDILERIASRFDATQAPVSNPWNAQSSEQKCAANN